MALNHSSSSAARRWRISLPVWVGVVVLLGSVGIAAESLRSHADVNKSPGASAPAGGEERRWMALGYVDVEGGVTPLYPVQPGEVKSIEVHENEPVKTDAPLFHLDNALQLLQQQEADFALAAAKQKLILAEGKVKQFHDSVAAQTEAVAAAKADADIARLRWKKAKKLVQDGVENADTSEGAELLFKKAEAGVKAEEYKLAGLKALNAEDAVKLASMDVEAKEVLVHKAKLAVDKCIVRAPCAGTPLRVLISVGQTLGSNPRQPAIQFCPDRPLFVRAEVEQEFADRIHKDQVASIQDHVTGKPCGRGKVTSISRWYTHRRSILLDPLQFNDVRTLECLIKLDSAQDVRIGQRVRVQLSDSDK